MKRSRTKNVLTPKDIRCARLRIVVLRDACCFAAFYSIQSVVCRFEYRVYRLPVPLFTDSQKDLSLNLGVK